MSIPFIIELMMGAGIIGLLWKIQRELGGITALLNFLEKGYEDHESRIRGLEAKPVARVDPFRSGKPD